MYAVLGASGHVGSAVVEALRTAGKDVVAVVRSATSATALQGLDVEIRVIDVLDTDGLRNVFKEAHRAFLLNPPADPSVDTDAAEMETAKSIAEALSGSEMEKVVLASTYGAQPGERIGDLSVLYAFETMVRDSGIPTAVNRGAYYFTNLNSLLDPARQGTITSPFHVDLLIPMVSPIDIGHAAAARLLSSISDTCVQYIEGPTRISFEQIAEAFSRALRQEVALETIPTRQIEDHFRSLGFSKQAADAYARMTKVSLDAVDLPVDPKRGTISLEEHLRRLMDKSS